MTIDGARPDLLFQDEVRDLVRRSYQRIPHGAGRAIAERFYSMDELAVVPERAISWALGVGNPVRHAELAPGEVVLDLGCGGGVDSVLAAVAVGPGGRVVALDQLDDMCHRAAAAAEEAGVGDRCSFHQGLMEAIPLAPASVDVVIANGVLNLSPRRSRVLAEVARVLRPGGRLVAVDLVVERDLPPEVLASEAAWAGCIAGAVSERVLAGKLERAGLRGVQMGERRPFGLDDVACYPLFTPEVVELLRRLLTEPARQQVAEAVLVQAVKPAVAPARPEVRLAPSGVASLVDIAAHTTEAPGVAVRELKAVDDVSLKVLDVDPGSSTPYHEHLHAHEGVIISGAGTLRLGDRHLPLGPGDVFSVNPNDPHAIAGDGPGPLRFVCLDCFVE